MNAFEAIQALGLWGKAHPQLVIGGICAVPLLMAGVKLVTGRGRSAGDTHGSARWATPRELRKAGLYARHGVICGKIKTALGTRILCDDSDTHILLLGPTRSRKGRGHIGPTLRHSWRQSALILDPANGENYDLTHAWRQRYGAVYRFTPHQAPQDCINVGDSIRWETPHEFQDALLIGESLVAPEDMSRPSDTGNHFRQMASFLLAGALLHVRYATGFCSLAATWHWLSQQQESVSDAMAEMRSTSHVSAGVHYAIESLAKGIGNASGRSETSGIWSTTARPLMLYTDRYVARSTDTTTMDIGQLQHGAVPASLYLIAPSTRRLRTLSPIYRVIIEAIMEVLMRHKPQTFAHRLLLVCDELPAYGYVRTIDLGAADIAKYGQKLFAVAQDLDQFEKTFGEKNSLWGNTHLKLFHTPANDQTAERLSKKMMGQGTMDNPVHQQEGGISGRRSVSVQHVARALLTPDEFMELDLNTVVGRMSGCKPFRLTKVDIDNDFTE